MKVPVRERPVRIKRQENSQSKQAALITGLADDLPTVDHHPGILPAYELGTVCPTSPAPLTPTLRRRKDPIGRLLDPRGFYD